MRVAVVDYGSGNLHSALKALERATLEGGSGADIVLTADPGVVRRADRIVLPGVGAFADCKRGLDAVPGMVEALDEAVHRRARPFLGICVGMQLLATTGLEHGGSPGLGWIAGEVAAIEPGDPELKIPHMGWNTLDVASSSPHPLLAGIPTGPDGWHAYFVTPMVFVPMIRPMSSLPQTTAAPSPRSSGATRSSARSSILRRAKRSASRFSPTS